MVAFTALGRNQEADALLERLISEYQDKFSYEIAHAFAFKSQADKAFAWLGRAYELRDSGLSDIKTDPIFRNLHSDPRWELLLEKIGLPND